MGATDAGVVGVCVGGSDDAGADPWPDGIPLSAAVAVADGLPPPSGGALAPWRPHAAMDVASSKAAVSRAVVRAGTFLTVA